MGSFRLYLIPKNAKLYLVLKNFERKYKSKLEGK